MLFQNLVKLKYLCCAMIVLPLLPANRLGLQSGPQKSIDVTAKFMHPKKFFEKYAIPGIPVLFKGVAKTFPAFYKWTDEYFESLPESKTFSVFAEEGKKEYRGGGAKDLSFSEFLKSYRHEDIYCVNAVPHFLASDIPVYLPLSCPFILNNLLEDNVMWFSSGGTKSVWHNDAYENINCLFRGRKEFIMANRSETKEKVHIDINHGAYSSVDVDNVDTDKYPGLKDTQFYNVTMEAGDCLYIPWLWFHQVTSFGSNLAVNIWWRTYRTPFLCDELSSVTLDQLNFRAIDGNNELRHLTVPEAAHQLIYMQSRMYVETTIDNQGFGEAVALALNEQGMNYVTDRDIDRLFALLDVDKDGFLNYTEIDSILVVFPKFLLLFKDEL